MMDNWIWISMLCSIGIASLAMATGAWLPRAKGLAGWLMAIGGTLFLAGVGGMTVFFIFPALGQSSIGGETTGIILYTSLSGGLLLFSMGYLTDRIRHRKVQAFHQEIQAPPGADPR